MDDFDAQPELLFGPLLLASALATGVHPQMREAAWKAISGGLQ
jgi:hypothetical protein